ncbi:unnamed protein product [Soboliphyme baturini]|uniref:CDC73_C domain-containing protein n=1 Tax=Soboliphyme baturini TaxID=241478 RepID=A0A183IZY1_9BILA|nr:unnamed protein product [Soboliphyme baturini]
MDLTKEVVSRELQWRTRTTIMEALSKNFAKSIFPLFQAIRAREEEKVVAEEALLLSDSSDLLKALGRTGYNRYDQERFRKEEALLASRTPVIVIPATGNSLITMYNAKEILKDLRFVSTEHIKLTGVRRENEILIHRQKEGATSVPYRIIDNPLKLNEEEWDRVVAVFVHGPAWQFKGWPWNGNPTEIFGKVCAFHLKWDDVKLEGNVSRWAVNIIALSRTKRHLDRANLLKFWETLDR